MPKLTDTQLVILSTAAGRESHAVLPLPKSLKVRGTAANKTLDGLCRKGLLEEKITTPDAESWREEEDGRRMTLVITAAGLQAIDGAPTQNKGKPPARDKSPAKMPVAQRKAARAKPRNGKPKAIARKGTKQALVLGLLKRKSGATLDEMVKATGWQAHSVRAALTGLRKRGIPITRSQENDMSVYRAGAD